MSGSSGASTASSVTTGTPSPKNTFIKLSMEELIAQKLAQDRPTMDAAIKSFLSLALARTNNGSATGITPATLMACAKTLLHAINTYTFSVKDDAATTTSTSLEHDTIATLWNGLVESNQKPSRFLGRLALLECWKDILVHTVHPNAADYDSSVLFFEEFGTLLLQYSKDTAHVPDEDSDAHLIWGDANAELERRRTRRAKRAEANKDQERASKVVTTLEGGEVEMPKGE